MYISHRKNQTIGGMLVHNKYRASGLTVSSDTDRVKQNFLVKQNFYLPQNNQYIFNIIIHL